MSNRVRLVSEDIFTEYIKDVNICLKKSKGIVSRLKRGMDDGDYMMAINNLDKICVILDNLTEMSFKEARIRTGVLKQNNEKLYEPQEKHEEGKE